MPQRKRLTRIQEIKQYEHILTIKAAKAGTPLPGNSCHAAALEAHRVNLSPHRILNLYNLMSQRELHCLD